MQHNDEIDQGATFYRVVSLYTDEAKTVPATPTDGSPRAALMDAGGAVIAQMPCAWLADGSVAWTMPRAATATLKPFRVYQAFMYFDRTDELSTDPVFHGRMTVNPGQVKP